MIITSQHDLILYQKAAKLSTQILSQLKQAVKPGILPIKIDELAEKLCQTNHARPAFKGVNPANPYRYSTCISINDVVVHGVPSKTRPIQAGDVVKVDFGLIYQGFYTDHCFTVVVKPFTPQTKKLVTVARTAVQAAIPLAITGNTTGDLGAIMQAKAEKAGFNVLKQYTGHGIGRTLHDGPAIPAHGQPKTGALLEKNQVLCLEAQVVTGGDQVAVAEDGWSVKTQDGGLSAMFEYMVVVGNTRPLILTQTLDWEMIG
ncbi:MAG: type I methionyl aminopeptidase [Patescibacteria group bacterium]|nr:type I methionyl aminopeptidase [Patescibacteria group bacterium]